MEPVTHDPAYEFVLQMAAEAILVLDATGVIVRLNPAAAALLGLGPGAVGTRLAERLPQLPALIALAAGKGLAHAVIRLPQWRLVEAVGGDLPQGGRVLLLHDVTERADIEARRAAVVRQVAHDLRNPLNAISGYADLVGRFGPLSAEQQQYLARVQQTADKLFSLAETLVDLAWIEAGMALEHRPVMLAQVIRQAVQDLAAQAAARRIALVLSLQDPVPPVIGDAVRLGQAVRHLLDNALRYSPEESTVAVHLWQNGPRLYCSVGDRGIGIRPEDLPHIWERLWRSADERVRAVPGGGIGLALAKAVIARHGGRIWAESVPEVGTTVTFVLPLAEGW